MNIQSFLKPITDQLKVGVTPHKLALSIAFGVVIGISPILGITTITCIVFAHIFKLNHIATQTVNYFSYPLQLLLLVPFVKAGEYIFPKQIKITSMPTFQKYIIMGIKAASIWIMLAPLIFATIYFTSRYLLTKVRVFQKNN